MNRKLVVFVPREALDPLREALFAAGAGRIGDYERCSWYTEGTGTFLGGEGSSPSVGQPGREQRLSELRLETVYPEEREAEVVAALREAHPYEEPAFDLYVLAVKARLFDGRRLARQPGAGRVRLRARGRGRHRARRARRGDRDGHEQRRRVPRPARRPEKALERGVDEVEVVSDSELLVKQMRGEYKVKNEALRELVDDAEAPRAPPRSASRYTAVRREHNELADRLVNEALDSAA